MFALEQVERVFATSQTFEFYDPRLEVAVNFPGVSYPFYYLLFI